MKLNLEMSDLEFGMVWEALGHFPARQVFALMQRLQQQVEAQEAAVGVAPLGDGGPDPVTPRKGTSSP